MALKLIISPAKKMSQVDDPPFSTAAPTFLDDAIHLAEVVRELTYAEAQELWKCSDKLADLNYERFRTLAEDMRAEPTTLTAAVMAYEGIQYQHIQPSVMTERDLAYLDRHLRIISGMYGVLRPFDGVVPYRLEMQAKLAVGGNRNLYEYWDSRAYDAIVAEKDTTAIVNLASQEYAKAVLPHALPDGPRIVTCTFGKLRASDGKLIQRSTEAKAARGTFVRWCTERRLDDVEGLVQFDERGYAFDSSRSTSEELVFVQP